MPPVNMSPVNISPVSMSLVSKLLFPMLLFLLAAGLMVWHVKAWRNVRDGERDEDERQFQWRRFRRRMQVSGMLALAAVGVAGGLLVPGDRQPSLFVYVWCGVFLVTLWILLMALADAMSTRSHIARLRRRQMEDIRL